MKKLIFSVSFAFVLSGCIPMRIGGGLTYECLKHSWYPCRESIQAQHEECQQVRDRLDDFWDNGYLNFTHEDLLEAERVCAEKGM